MLFKDGEEVPIKFTAPREKESIISWLKEQTGLAGAEKEDAAEL